MEKRKCRYGITLSRHHGFFVVTTSRYFFTFFEKAYCGGLCFDLLAKILHKKLVISSIRVKKFTQDTYFVGGNIKKTDFVAPVSLAEGLKRTIEYEFVNKVQGHTFSCE